MISFLDLHTSMSAKLRLYRMIREEIMQSIDDVNIFMISQMKMRMQFCVTMQ